jgi:hypothetical protein
MTEREWKMRIGLVGGGPDLVSDHSHHEQKIEAEGPED